MFNLTKIIFATSLAALFSCVVNSVQEQNIPPVVWGDFESLPGGRGNIAEFGKALRLPTGLSDKNIVQFYRDGDVFHHRFLFDNTSRVLAFAFKFGELMTLQIHDKTIEYSYILETTSDPYRATIFARYEEQNGMMRFTVEAVFSRNGMVVTYTHADVLDSIMARRTYRRMVPKAALGYYENFAEKESGNFKNFAQSLPVPDGATFGPQNKVYLGQSSRQFMIKYLLDPESAQITFPFTVGDKQRKFMFGKNIEYIVDVEKGDLPNITIIRAQFREGGSERTYISEFVIDGKAINATYKRGDIVATRVYRRALPLNFYGTFVAVPESEENYGPFSSLFQDSSIGVADTVTKIRFYRENASFHQETMNVFGMTETVSIPFELDGHTAQDIVGKPFKISYNYDGGERPTLHVTYENVGGESSFVANYTFTGSGIFASYKRESVDGPVLAKRFYRRQLPALILGRYESVDNTEAFKAFANGIFFPELTSKTTMEYLEHNGSYVQKFSYGPGVHTTFQEVPFVLGEKQEQLVKGKWMMEYTYNAWEGDRVFLISIFSEKLNGTKPSTFGEFSRVGDFTKGGYTSVYTLGNVTAKRAYRRLA